MSICVKKFYLILSILPLFVLYSSNSAQQNRNSISGIIYDGSNNRPLSDVYVELKDDVYTTLSRSKTDSSGRFYFGNLVTGRFKVTVIPLAMNLLEETKDVEIVNITLGNTSTLSNETVDFYLRVDKRKINNLLQQKPSSVFVQSVPPDAEEFFKKAVIQLKSPAEVELGIDNLKAAIGIFPDYYDALLQMGMAYTNQNKFYEAIPVLIKTITVNQRSFMGFYSLGVSAFNLKQYSDAELAFKAATSINPLSDYAFTQYGMILRVLGKYKDAEIALLKAKSLGSTTPKSEIYWQLALLYEKIGRRNDAADQLETFLKIEPNTKDAKQIKELILKLRNKL
jgi:Tetratricopeptide repeat